MKNIINWKIFYILLGLSLISVICILPYVMTIQGDVLRQIGLPLWQIIMAQLIQGLIMFSVAIFGGLVLLPKINFGTPVLVAIVNKKNIKNELDKIWRQSVMWGVTVSIAIYAMDAGFNYLGATISTHKLNAPIWQTLLASVYGGITEEILMRLFLMSLFIWIGMKIFGHKRPSNIGIIVAILIASIIFGLGHLPITASLTAITPLVVVRAIILNGIGGIVFGWLFWKKGIESAMLAHFTTDVFLLSIWPLLLS